MKMKQITSILLASIILTFSFTAKAQMTQDPTNWEYEVKKTGANTYQLIYHLTLKAGWHIWSIKPGGDGFQIAPSFTIKPQKGVKTIGKVTEKGKAITTTMDGVTGKVTYYANKVDYIQNISVANPTTIMGTLSYQVCNDKMCLPPKDKDFTIKIK